MDDYTILEKIGEGSYGVVNKIIDKKGNIFAVKKLRIESAVGGVPPTAIREIALLKQLKHPNVLKIVNVIHADRKLNLIFEYIEQDLRKLLMKHENGLDLQTTKSILFQMLKGIDYCHKSKILHRDLKPQNILITNNGLVKIADFGLARTFGIPVKQLTHEIVTLCYRPPDVLMGNRNYGITLDLWSIGCIFAEMLNNKRIFDGKHEIDQLHQIFSILGTDDLFKWESARSLPLWDTIAPTIMPTPKISLKKLLPKLDVLGHDLLVKLLQYNPDSRINAEEALNHPFFAT